MTGCFSYEERRDRLEFLPGAKEADGEPDRNDQHYEEH